MCIIVDANLASLVFASPILDDFVPLIDWLTSPKRDGKLVVGGKLSEELNKVSNVGRFIQSLSRAGRARLISKEEVDKETKKVESLLFCKSNDSHVIALARVSGARVLCTKDRELHADFKNPMLIPETRGRIYQSHKHKNLLHHDTLCQMKIRAELKSTK